MKQRPTLTSRTTRILIFSIAFFVSGLIFFLVRMVDGGGGSERVFLPDTRPEIEEKVRLVPSLATYPLPEVFHQFVYTRGEALVVRGECVDAYYTIMIFPAETDYRAHPEDARFNTAYPCKGSVFMEHVPIDTLFLSEGEGYYVVKAHQGEVGEWYSPY